MGSSIMSSFHFIFLVRFSPPPLPPSSFLQNPEASKFKKGSPSLFALVKKEGGEEPLHLTRSPGEGKAFRALDEQNAPLPSHFSFRHHILQFYRSRNGFQGSLEYNTTVSVESKKLFCDKIWSVFPPTPPRVESIYGFLPPGGNRRRA